MGEGQGPGQALQPGGEEVDRRAFGEEVGAIVTIWSTPGL